MAWENIEENLKHALTIKVSFPAGTIWLPQSHLSIDSWLESVAETDEELQELDIPRTRFLQNRWPIDELVELEWDDEFSNRRVIVAMYVGQRAYILFSDWSEYQVIAAVEPKDKPSLYRAVIGNLLESCSFIPAQPTHFRNHRPDLVPDLVAPSLKDRDRRKSQESHLVFASENFSGIGRQVDSMHPGSKLNEKWKGFLSDVLVGWIGKWLNLPEPGFWHEDVPESITRTNEGEILMRPSYGDKQREAQKRQKEE